ncbi:MAG: glycosyltransferase [Actinomycetota bacterium]|nr:glycosyltransferase [Actinomycetota bacterium]
MSASVLTEAGQSLVRAMHRLWIDHVIWTRQYVVSALNGHPDGEAAAERLLKNQEDIGNAIAGFYGPEVGGVLTDLLKQHVFIAVDLVDAAIKGDQERFANQDKRWDENAAEIARFLSSVNPYWPEKDVHDLINLHLALTRREVVARLNKHWKEDVSAFDDILTEILTLAEALADGIVQQFPFRFSVPSSGKQESEQETAAVARAG